MAVTNGVADGPGPVRFRVRAEVVTLACIGWMSVPFLVLFAYLAVPWHWLAYVGLPFLLTFPVALLVALMVNFPASVRRLGAWLERHVDTGR
jgi:hypothetical protein